MILTVVMYYQVLFLLPSRAELLPLGVLSTGFFRVFYYFRRRPPPPPPPPGNLKPVGIILSCCKRFCRLVAGFCLAFGRSSRALLGLGLSSDPHPFKLQAIYRAAPRIS